MATPALIEKAMGQLRTFIPAKLWREALLAAQEKTRRRANKLDHGQAARGARQQHAAHAPLFDTCAFCGACRCSPTSTTALCSASGRRAGCDASSAARWCSMGDPCESFFVVASGQVRLFVIAPNGNEGHRALRPGPGFAEALMFLGKPCLVNAQALADRLLIEVPRAALLAELALDGASRSRCWPASRGACTALCMTCRPMRCSRACNAWWAICCATSPMGATMVAGHGLAARQQATVASRLS